MNIMNKKDLKLYVSPVVEVEYLEVEEDLMLTSFVKPGGGGHHKAREFDVDFESESEE